MIYVTKVYPKQEIHTMTGDDVEICGFMDAKIPNNLFSKKRSLQVPWKVWRRHWCHIRKLGLNFGLEILLDRGVGSRVNTIADKDNTIRIPADAIVCRTESRSKRYAFGIFPAKERKALIYMAANSESESQKWISNIRQLLRPRRFRYLDGTFNVSMVDNKHSRLAGLTALYGDMVISRSGVFMKDPHTGDIAEMLEWKDTNSIHLCCSGLKTDVKKIVTIHTTKEFCCGVGELNIFCMEASQLLLALVRQGKSPRPRRNGRLIPRPFSLSESDLSTLTQQQEAKEDIDNREKPYQSVQDKATMNVITMGVVMLSSSRAGSEAKLINDFEKDKIVEKIESTYNNKRAVDNVYLTNFNATPNTKLIDFGSSLEELEEPSMKRVSNISVASGVYEEILDDITSTRLRRVPSHLYEDPDDVILNSKVKLQPPPLPPRRRTASGSTRNGSSLSDDGLDSESDSHSATPSIQDDATPTPEDLKSLESEPEKHKQNQSNTIVDQIDTSEYVQMSPRPGDIVALELHQRIQHQIQVENMYMVMR